MPVPKRKTTKSKRNMRRAHDALKKPAWVNCSSCGEPKQLHRACPSCGMYKGRQVIQIVEKT